VKLDLQTILPKPVPELGAIEGAPAIGMGIVQATNVIERPMPIEVAILIGPGPVIPEAANP
jgi:hypothetical protein